MDTEQIVGNIAGTAIKWLTNHTGEELENRGDELRVGISAARKA